MSPVVEFEANGIKEITREMWKALKIPILTKNRPFGQAECLLKYPALEIFIIIFISSMHEITAKFAKFAILTKVSYPKIYNFF